MSRFTAVALAAALLGPAAFFGAGCASVEDANSGGGLDLSTPDDDDLGTSAPAADLARSGGDGGSTTPSCGGGKHIVVNEVKVGTAAQASDEFIELYNPCTNDVDLTNWTLVYRSAAGTSDVTIIGLGKTIVSNGFLLVVGPAYTGGVPGDQTYNAGKLAAAGGGVGLRDPTQALVDSVGYGTATNAFVEGAPVNAPGDGSIARTPSGIDTNHNNLDFAVATTPTPGAAN
jgi:hypothetical protein